MHNGVFTSTSTHLLSLTVNIETVCEKKSLYFIIISVLKPDYFGLETDNLFEESWRENGQFLCAEERKTVR